MTHHNTGEGRARESDIAKAVMQHWRALALPGTLVASIPNQFAAGQYGLTKGLPDFLIMGPDLPVGFIELKTERGRISEAQLRFKDICEHLSIPHAITRGRDEPIALLEQWGIVRASK
jgi:hypothetical protein